MYTGCFVLSVFTCFLKVGSLEEVLIRTFICLPAHPWICRWIKMSVQGDQGHSLVGFTFKECHLRGTGTRTRVGLPPTFSPTLALSGMWKPFAPKCPRLEKLRSCHLLAGCKLLSWLFSHLSVFLFTCQNNLLIFYSSASLWERFLHTRDK